MECRIIGFVGRTRGEFRAPLIPCQIVPPTAPIANALPKSERITQGLQGISIDVLASSLIRLVKLRTKDPGCDQRGPFLEDIKEKVATVCPDCKVRRREVDGWTERMAMVGQVKSCEHTTDGDKTTRRSSRFDKRRIGNTRIPTANTES